MTYLQEHKKRDSADSLYGALKMNVRHILGISDDKTFSNLSAVSRRPYYFSITFLTAVKKYILPFKKK